MSTHNVKQMIIAGWSGLIVINTFHLPLLEYVSIKNSLTDKEKLIRDENYKKNKQNNTAY